MATMAHWRDYSTVWSDVVFFRYIAEGVEKNADEIFVWDLDKTYLDTSWGGFFELMKVALERAMSKKNIPGTNTLIRSLVDQWQAQKSHRHFPLYFITASPPQMESRISEKLSFDGIFPFGCFYKDNLQNLHPKRLWRLTKQVGYKVQALLQLRTMLKQDVRQVLWGDDSESDAVIYNLYSDICSRRLGPHDLRQILGQFWVTGEQVDIILQLQSSIPENDPVEKIYINLASDTDPDYYLKFGRRTVPTYNSFQTALDLYQDKRLDFEKLLKVAKDMTDNYDFTNDELCRSFDELIRRKLLAEPFVGQVTKELQEAGVMPLDFTPSVTPYHVKAAPLSRGFDIVGVHEPWISDRIDYLHDYR
jgi:hypothetical protein